MGMRLSRYTIKYPYKDSWILFNTKSLGSVEIDELTLRKLEALPDPVIESEYKEILTQLLTTELLSRIR